MMRQDLSTYESKVVEKMDVEAQLAKAVRTIELRQARVKNLIKVETPNLIEFLGSIVHKVEELSQIDQERRANF